MLQRLHGASSKAGTRGGAAECARQGHLLSGEAVYTMGWWIDFELVRQLPVDVDEQVRVRGARIDHDRAQMPLSNISV